MLGAVMTRRTGILVTLIAAALAATFYLITSASGKSKITIAQVGDFFLYAPVYVAQDAGFFQKQGLAGC
jgi:ABC-type nitrate/sulfonate/bicarbonate transport system substrate-binding protein